MERVRFTANGSCLIQFKTTEDANSVLSHGAHRIVDWIVNAKAAELCEQPSNILNALNDDCLRKIFLYLDMKTLIKAAEVCIRFNERAKETFANKFNVLDLYYLRKFKPAKLDRFFENFGAVIRSLEMYQEFNSVKDLERATKYCTSLKSLKLWNLRIGEQLTEQLKPLFTTLESLTLIECGLEGDSTCLISTCVDLKMLDLYFCDIGDGKCIEQQFKKLEEAIISICGVSSETIINFIKKNPTLEKLTLENDAIHESKLIQTVIAVLPNLTELTINKDAGDVVDLTDHFSKLLQLTSLKVLKLNFNSLPIAPFVENLIASNLPIEHFGILGGKINRDTINSISKMTNIKALELPLSMGNLTDDYSVQLAKALPKLEQLHFLRSGLSYARR